MSVNLKKDYDRSSSRQLATFLNADNTQVEAALNALGSGGSGTGPGRIVGSDYTVGRVEAVPEDLLLKLFNATYRINGEDVVVDDPAGFVLIPVPASMDPGKYGYLSKTEDGSVEVTSAHWRSTLATDLEGLPNIGFVTSDTESVTAIDYTEADELQTNARLLREIIALQVQLDALAAGGGGGEGGGAAFASVLPWSALDNTATTVKVQQLIDAAKAELKDYIDNGTTRTMQLPWDYLTETLYRTRSALIRLSPEAADLAEAAEVVVGFAGHAADGAPPPALGVNGTTNVLSYTTLQVNTPERSLEP